jgi:hypothetical protein
MTPALWIALFQQIVIPEVASWMSSRATGAPAPTADQILAQMNAIAQPIVDAGEAFLKSKGAA